MIGTGLNNEHDPLGQTEVATRELFKRLGAECNAFPIEAVAGAAANLLINAVRQQCKTRGKAEAAFDEMAARLKGVLMAHYDGVTEQRRSIFPFNQVIEVPHFDLSTKAH